MKTKDITAVEVEVFFNDIKVLTNTIVTRINEQCAQFFNELKPACDKIDNIRKEYGIYGIEESTGFNIFKSISDKYRYENFHSEVLRNILDPNTKKTADKEYLKLFIDVIEERFKSEKREFDRHDFEGNVAVETESPIKATDSESGETERGRIDIFIYAKDDEEKITHSIIIENKLKWATDTHNQLLKYVEYAREEKIKIVAVVYLPPTPKEPPSNDSYDRYKDAIDELKTKRIVLPGIDKNKIDLAHGFLDKCATYARKKNDIKMQVYIEDYSSLVKELGGNIMTADYEKELFEKLFADDVSIKTTKTIVEIWEKRLALLAQIIHENLHSQLKFAPYDELASYKPITEKISLAFFYNPAYKKSGYRFGFGLEDGTNQKMKKKLEDILLSFKENLSPDDVETDGDWIIFKKFDLNIEKPSKEIVDTVIEMYKQLEKKATGLID